MGWARVSSVETNPAQQHDALRATGCARIEIDRAGGVPTSPPARDRLLLASTPGDTVVEQKLDRPLAARRSPVDLLTVVTDLAERGIGSGR